METMQLPVLAGRKSGEDCNKLAARADPLVTVYGSKRTSMR